MSGRALFVVAIAGLVVLAVLVAISPRGPQPIPFDGSLPSGAVVVYRVDRSQYGFYGDPVRIIRIGDLCVTESFNTDHEWMFEASGKCP
jgi:hypothetical protein